MGRVGKEREVCDELVLSRYLEIIWGFGVGVVDGMLFDGDECGRRMGVGIGVRLWKGMKVIVVLYEVVRIGLKLGEVVVVFGEGFVLLVMVCWRVVLEGLFKLMEYVREGGGSKVEGCVFYRVVVWNVDGAGGRE